MRWWILEEDQARLSVTEEMIDDDAEDEHLAPAEHMQLYPLRHYLYPNNHTLSQLMIVGSLGSELLGIRTGEMQYHLRFMRTEIPECGYRSLRPFCVLLLLERGLSRELQCGIGIHGWNDLVGAIQEIAPTTLEGVNQRVIELSSTIDQEDEIIYSQLDDARYDRALLRARVNRLDSDRPFHRRTALLIEEEARLS
ncbi:hypothetical protein Tco_1111233 [Tanacetum coccineum]|uniref:Uncharacterized protein n=1 Tax=Tanacetum coccineum TaxID=301880 RepID=A0ABQ5IMI9_9ASTR